MSRNRSMVSRSSCALRSEGQGTVSAWSAPEIAEADEDSESSACLEESKHSGVNAVLRLSDLPMDLPDKFRLSLNPFKLYFSKSIENDYMEWIHLDYIPFRAWLLTSALVGSLDTVLYGPRTINIHMALMLAVNAIQVVVFVVMCLRQFAAYRRFMVYVQFLHVFFWAGMTSQEASEGLSGMHQNSFMVLPYYCAFICAIFAQVPVRQ
eukprot:RCo050923